MRKITECNNDELMRLLISHIKCNELNPKHTSTINVTGEPDSGKTTAITEAYIKMGYKVIYFNLATNTDTYDLNGNPIIQVEIVDTVTLRKEYVNETIAGALINERTKLTGNQRTVYVLPESLQNLRTHDKVVLFFDDFTRGNRFVVAAVMELINTGVYSAWGKIMPTNFQIALSSNEDDGENNVVSLDVANHSRMCTVRLKWSIDNYMEYKLKDPVLEPIRNFVNTYRKDFTENVFRRRFEHVITAYKGYRNNDITYKDFTNKVKLECPEISNIFINFIDKNDMISIRTLLDSKDVDKAFNKEFVNLNSLVNNPKLNLFISNFFMILSGEVNTHCSNFTKEDFEVLFKLFNTYLGKDLKYLINQKLLKLQKEVGKIGESHYLFSMYFDIDTFDKNDELIKLVTENS